MTEARERTETDLLYDYLQERSAQFGALITYTDLEAVLGRDLRENRAPLYAAKRRLQKEMRRSLRCVPDVGYRVPNASEHVEMAGERWGRAGRQLTRARGELNGTDMAALSPEEKRRHDSTSRQNAALIQEVMLHRRKLKQHEEWLGKLDKRVDKLETKPTASQDDIREMIRQELKRQARG